MLARYVLWPCVCLFVHPSQVGVPSKRLNVMQPAAHGSLVTPVFDAKDLDEVPMRLSQQGRQMHVAGNNCDFDK